jgi:hypothetical protein
MPTFKLSDNFGFSTDIQAGPGALSRYFQNLPDLAVLAINLKQFTDTTWDDPAVATTHNKLSFKDPVNIGGQAVALKVAAGLNGTLSIFVPSTDKAPLFAPDLFGDNIPVALDQRYVSAGIQASVAVGASTTAGPLGFGFDGQSAVNLTYWQPFRLNPVTPKVLESIRQTLAAFTIPGELQDIEAMPEGSVATVESTGDLKFSGTVNVLAFTNPLASAKLPVLGDVAVNAGGSVDVGAGFEFSGDYQIRVQRLPGAAFRLGFYRQRQTDFSITASASASITTSLDDNPLFKKLLPAISSQPAIDQNELAGAGVSRAQIAALQSALKSAIDRTLSLGVSMELHTADENDAMFLYEVDLSALTPDSKALLRNALNGDLTDLVSKDREPGPGIRVVKTLIESSKTLKHIFKINLLGIYNALTVSSLVKSGSVAWDSTTGEFVLTDSANASRIGINAVNFGADSEKLRHVLAENLLMTAAYRAGSCVSGPPNLRARHTHFTLSTRTNQDDMSHDVLLGEGLGFGEAANAIANLPPELRDFGRTTVLAEASYDDGAFTALFFDGTRQRDKPEYDRAGRDAIRFLVRPGGPRLLPVNDDQLWATMRRIGNVKSAEFRQLFPNLAAVDVSAIGVDYLNIVWWTDAMRSTGDCLAAIRKVLDHPGVSRTDPEFVAAKQALAGQLAKLDGRTQQDFGGPWGLLAMSLAAPVAGRRFLLLNAHLTLTFEKRLPLVAEVTG